MDFDLTKHHHIIREIESLLSKAFYQDILAARRKLTLVKQADHKYDDEKLGHDLIKLKERLHLSVKKRARRKSHVPELFFDPSLPITAKKR